MRKNQKLTKRVVESIKTHETKELLVWDSELKGFGVRVFPTGRRTYFVQYRNQFGGTRRKKIGVHGVITADLAREEAKKLLGDVAKGEDPSQDFQKTKLKPTFEELAYEYIEFYAKDNKRPKSYREDQRMLNKILLKRFCGKKIEEITTYEIQHLHHEFRENLYKANRVYALLHRMFTLAIQWQWIALNPAEGIHKYKEQPRNTWLKDKELQKLYDVLDCYQDQKVANLIRLLILTGARKNEALSATWDQFDLEKGVWTKPSHATKGKKMEHIPISPQAVSLLQKMAAESTSPYLFPGRVPGKHLIDPKNAWNTIRKQAGFPDFRIHDIRHTYASHLVSNGLSLSIVGKLLGHTQISTTQRYAHLADESLRQATEFFGNKVEKLTEKIEHK